MKKTLQKIGAVAPPLPRLHSTAHYDFPIAGIGVSAGGLETLERFFSHMPENCGIAFVVVQHLDPTHDSIMHELIQRVTPMKVYQATDGLELKPNTIYVMPPNRQISIQNGHLNLLEPSQSTGIRLPIDSFFLSLADERGNQSIGIVLSGMGCDGSLGLKSIKLRGGLALVQDPATAKFDAMPKSAIEHVSVDIIATVEELPARLLACLKNGETIHPKPNSDAATTNIQKIIVLLRDQCGHDFSLYKKSTLMRRIEKRKGFHQIGNIQSYVRFLQDNPKEIDILYSEILIGVTSFFRDTAMWEKLGNEILPEMLAKLPDKHTLRAWVTACSTGEEAYSLAMLFQEVQDSLPADKKISLQIFATDLDHNAIKQARKGIFSGNIVGDVSPERLKRFFLQEKGGYRVHPAIREMVVFAQQNVTKDPPFTKIDILTCRNMLIYLEPELQNRLFSLFQYSLNTGGIMILGSAETPAQPCDRLKAIDTKNRIYSCITPKGVHSLPDFSPTSCTAPALPYLSGASIKVTDNLQLAADSIVLQRFAPASVLVKKSGDILYITGKTGKYLEPASGISNWNIFAMARSGLALALPVLFRKAARSAEAITEYNVKIEGGAHDLFVDISVQRLQTPEVVNGMFIVVFSDKSSRALVDVAESAATQIRKRSTSSQAGRLEAKLKKASEELQSTREEMQSSQEELQSTNEELQSTNEELQSTNEELTTSKEELQSLNEELQTVNAELQSKISELTASNNDLKNLLNSTEIATLFLDRNLNIRRYTDSAAKVIKMRPSDAGRPFTELVNNLKYPDIEMHARQVLATLTPVESAITTHDHRWFGIRIMPYRTFDERIDGLVITFSDITAAKTLEAELRIANLALRNRSAETSSPAEQVAETSSPTEQVAETPSPAEQVC